MQIWPVLCCDLLLPRLASDFYLTWSDILAGFNPWMPLLNYPYWLSRSWREPLACKFRWSQRWDLNLGMLTPNIMLFWTKSLPVSDSQVFSITRSSPWHELFTVAHRGGMQPLLAILSWCSAWDHIRSWTETEQGSAPSHPVPVSVPSLVPWEPESQGWSPSWLALFLNIHLFICLITVDTDCEPQHRISTEMNQGFISWLCEM